MRQRASSSTRRQNLTDSGLPQFSESTHIFVVVPKDVRSAGHFKEFQHVALSDCLAAVATLRI
jgi:hypothetical protein